MAYVGRERDDLAADFDLAVIVRHHLDPVGRGGLAAVWDRGDQPVPWSLAAAARQAQARLMSTISLGA